MLLRATFIAACCALASCKSTTPEKPYYTQQPEAVGYFGKFNYWQPSNNNNKLAKKARSVRNQLITDGISVLVFSYNIDSNGNRQNLTLKETLPIGLLSQADLLLSEFAYSKFEPTPSNSTGIPVTVTERIITLPNGDITMPADDTSIEEHIKQIVNHYKKQAKAG